MTTADCHMQTFAAQQLGHTRVGPTLLYIHTDSTAATEYVDNAVIPVVDEARPDDEGEVTP
ncbi:hypothetical protein [Streptomyces sp. NPDC014995]|uniref:hypothetical protein n=1 Tax=Streptomyces sp. NPDC014995 TaxID=3364936 RepID=UPI0037015417